MEHNQSGDSPIRFATLLAFDVVARHLNFARAAAELAVTPTAISKSIKQLEEQLGVRLFDRTTRSVSLTESGTQLRESILPALEQIRRSVEQVRDTARRPHGALRLNTSYVAYASLIEPHLGAFLARFPDISFEVSIDNAPIDIVAERFDAGIRFGDAVQRDMTSVALGPIQRRVVVAAPSYLRRAPALETPNDLLAHDCIRQRLSPRARFFEWSFRAPRQRGNTIIEVRGRLVFDEMRAVVHAARQGCGLAYVFEQFARTELKSGALVTVLDRFSPPSEAFHLYYPHRAQMPGKLRAFIDFVRKENWSPPG